MTLPNIRVLSPNETILSKSSLFICCEGFEERSLAFIKLLNTSQTFNKSIIITYKPEKKSRLNELLSIVIDRTSSEPIIYDFNRYEPQLFETELLNNIESILIDIDEIVIDISVMSKLIIIILILVVSKYNGKLRIVYTEPVQYAPTHEEFEKYKADNTYIGCLPSNGVHDVVRTALTSSVIMQSAPSIVIAFASFNEQLVRALLSVINPSHFYLLNSVPPRLQWREEAMQYINKGIIEEYHSENKIDSDGRLINKVSTLYYNETFDYLSEMYKTYCYSYRMIISPTCSKLQALGCGLFKICCPDVHIEYPTPESINFTGYSTNEVACLYEVKFDNFVSELRVVCEHYTLNG